MPRTDVEYSLWNVPVNPNTDNIPYEDRWLFSDPYYVFPIGTPLASIRKTVARHPYLDQSAGENADADTTPVQPRFIGIGRTPSTVALRTRSIHYSDYRRVPPEPQVLLSNVKQSPVQLKLPKTVKSTKAKS